MPSNWEATSLGAVTAWLSGGTPKKDEPKYWGGDIPWISANSMYGTRFSESELRLTEAGLQSGSRLAPKGTVLLLVRGGALHKRIPVGIATRDVAFNQDVKALVAREEKIRPWYLLCWLLGMERHLLDSVVEYTGIGAGKLDTKRMQTLEILLPSLSEQDEIIATVKSLDDRIDLLQQTNTTLESIAQALFKSWFIDFDPVRAKAEGREPEGMDAGTAALFPAEFEESALGLIPKRWSVSAIRDVVLDVYDGPHATPPEVSDGPVFLGIKNLTGTALDLSEIRHIAESDWAQWTRRVTPMANDIVFSYEAALGLFALIPPGLRCCLGRRLALVRAKPTNGSPHFWFHQFIGATFQRLLAKHTVHGATVNRIALKEFPSFPVLDPGQAVRDAFEQVAAPLWARIHANQRQALNLTDLRDTLLPRLISGKLRLPEAQEQVEDALV